MAQMMEERKEGKMEERKEEKMEERKEGKMEERKEERKEENMENTLCKQRLLFSGTLYWKQEIVR